MQVFLQEESDCNSDVWEKHQTQRDPISADEVDSPGASQLVVAEEVDDSEKHPELVGESKLELEKHGKCAKALFDPKDPSCLNNG